MDPTHLDALARALGRPHPRRAVVAALLAGPLAWSAATATEARPKKRNPCKGKPDNTPCKGSGRCLSGVCNPPPTCVAAGASCRDGSTCCSGGCCSFARECCNGDCPDLSDGQCGNYPRPGKPCLTELDCNLGENINCVGYVCLRGVPSLTADFCADGTSFCYGGHPLRPLGGGDTRCGVEAQPVGSTCGCTSHEQCIKTHGVGAFCATFDPAAGVCACNGKHTFCAVPSG